jgi:hypothetical protein
VPLYLLYELSILVASLLGTPHGADDPTEAPAEAGEAAAEGQRAEPSVQQIIDHVDRDLTS